MKESITKFDLEAAFKALEDLDTPVVTSGVKANKPALTEIFSQKSKFDALFEEYYDIGDSSELADAKEAREADIAKAKLARIEKIVDLDAKSPEDLLTSYVGKFIIQCPQCMTLFYKNPEDVEESEDDSTVVNVNEVCQHCGNESGYTLIGKVGEAEPEEEQEMQEMDEPAEVSMDDTENNQEEADETNEDESSNTNDDEDLDLDLAAELEAIDLDDETAEEQDEEAEEDEEEQTNESVRVSNINLTENLEEEATLDVSADEFEKLIKSSEFKKSITDNEARAMMQEFTESATKIEDDEVALENLEEGVFDKLKGKFTNVVDKITSKLKSREDKADWVLQNTIKDYSKVDVSENGELAQDENNRRFNLFLVVCFRNIYSNGKLITMAPSYNNKDLLISKTVAKKKYKDADDIAKGWSMREENGPAFIYMVEDTNAERATFLCQYFKGELNNDQLDKYFEMVKKDLEGAKLEARGNKSQDDTTTTNVQTKEMRAADIKQGMILHLGKDTAEVLQVVKSYYGKNNLSIKTKHAAGDIETFIVKTDAIMNVVVSDVNESLENTKKYINTVMENLDTLQESSLENIISNALIESYKNVAGFRLKNCSYLNENFTVEGTIHFVSGNIRKTTYTFTEALATKEGLTELRGFNEKLGLDKKFVITGSIKDKTFITESLKAI